jgi:hypothetical protein
MIIGTDICLDTCRHEGYLMMEYDKRIPFNLDTEYRFFNYNPSYDSEEYRGRINNDIDLSFTDILERYNEDKEAINSCCETMNHINFDNPTYVDALNLASDLCSYQGLH